MDTKASSAVTDHPFEPRDFAIPTFTNTPQPYLCRHCDLAEAAHTETTVKR